MDSSALTTLVAAATEGMRKTQSADVIDGTGQVSLSTSPPGDGHQSDSAVAPTRERKKGTPAGLQISKSFLLSRFCKNRTKNEK
jgi:hypothetical protein